MLLLLPDAYGGPGGIARYGRDLVDALRGAPEVGPVVTLTRGRPAPAGPPCPDDVTEVRARGRVAFATLAVRIARRARPATVICGHVHYLRTALLLRRWTGARVIAIGYGIDVFTPRRRWVAAALRQVDRVVVISRYTRRRLLEWSGVDRHKVGVIGGALEQRAVGGHDVGAVGSALEERAVGDPGDSSTDRASRSGARDALRREVRERLDLPPAARLVLTVGRMDARERYKGHDELIDAAGELARRHPDVCLVFVGGGTDAPRLRERARQEGLATRVRVLDELAARDRDDLFAAADAFAMPSRAEGFGYVFLEALAAGLPVLAGDADGARDPLQDGELGVLVDPDDRAGLVDGLARLLTAAPPPPVPAGFRAPAFRARWRATLAEVVG